MEEVTGKFMAEIASLEARVKVSQETPDAPVPPPADEKYEALMRKIEQLEKDKKEMEAKKSHDGGSDAFNPNEDDEEEEEGPADEYIVTPSGKTVPHLYIFNFLVLLKLYVFSTTTNSIFKKPPMKIQG